MGCTREQAPGSGREHLGSPRTVGRSGMSDQSAPSGSALEDVSVLDLSRYGPGLLATMILADLGADVIHVEEPLSSLPPHRAFPVGADGRTEQELPEYAANRNKRSIVLDLKAERARHVFYRLVARADVVIEGFRPGVARRLGIDYETLRRRNRRLVYCSMSGYGQDGPEAARPGHDLNYLAFAGALSRSRDRSGAPVLPGLQLADFGGGTMHALVAVLAALRYRDRSGRGQYVDAAMIDGVTALMTNTFARYFAGIEDGRSWPVALTGASPYYNLYETRDERWLALCCNERSLWRRMCESLNRMDLVDLHDDPSRWPEATRSLRVEFRTRDLATWRRVLADVPIFPVQEIADVPEDPHARARRMFVEVPVAPGSATTVRQPASTMRLSEAPGVIRSLAPRRGEHTAAILSELGYTAREVEMLIREGSESRAA